MNKVKQVLLCGLLLLGTSNVFAMPLITGTMEMGGGFNPIDSRSNVTTADAATGIDFSFFGFDMFEATFTDGDFAGLTGQLGDITDFQFDSFTAPIANFWSIDIFSFELTDVARGFTDDPTNFLILEGEGIISAAGFADTQAVWNFSGDTSGGGVFSWSAVSVVNEVPEPGVLVLLAVGLLGFGLRKKV